MSNFTDDLKQDPNIEHWLQQLLQQGIELWVEEGKLRIRAPQGVLTDGLRRQLTERKAELVERLQRSTQKNTLLLPPLIPEPESRHEPFPLTDIQQAFWVGQNTELDLSGGYHAYIEYECSDLDISRLTYTWQLLIQRHEMLRAVILPPDQQRILDEVPLYQIPILNLVDETEPSKQKKLQRVRGELSYQIFDLTRWPLFDIRITQVESHRYHLHLSFALIMLDGGSLMRLLHEWNQLYQQSGTVSLTSLPMLGISYRDYVIWEQNLQRTELYKQAQQYWLHRVETLPPAPTLPQKPTHGSFSQMTPEHTTQTHSRIIHREAVLDVEIWQSLKEHCHIAGVTTTALLATIFAEVMTTWSGRSHFTLNLTFFSRFPVHPQINDILGDFSTVNLLEVDVDPTAPLRERARQLHQQLWTDLEYRYFNGVRVIREFARYHHRIGESVMPIVFTSLLGVDRQIHVKNTDSNHIFGGDSIVRLAQTPQVLLDIQIREEENKLIILLDSADESFPTGVVQDIFSSYIERVRYVAMDGTTLTEPQPCLIPSYQLEQRIVTNRETASIPIPEITLSELFAQTVGRYPDVPAIYASNHTYTDHIMLTYKELYTYAQQVSVWLRQQDVKPNTLVAVFMEKGWEQIVGVFGILLAGVAYLPIDPTLPEERRNYLLDKSDVHCLLTQPRLNDLAGLPSHIRRLSIDIQLQKESVTEPISQFVPAQQPRDLLYVLYTSGSTGQPKGVMIEHRGVVNRMLDVVQRFNIQPTDRVLALTALHHDISAFDVFAMLAVAGGAVVMPDADKTLEPEHWIEQIRKHNVTIWFSVPAFMQMLVEYLESVPELVVSLKSLRLVMLGGDFIPVTLPKRLKMLLPQVAFFSVGGPTETSVLDICYPVTDVDVNWTTIPYGKPLRNTQYHVLNDNLQPCPTWVPGELYIAGSGLARGYWRDPEGTKASFITDPQSGARLYRSGDLGRYLPDGNLEILGRKDFQVKIGGQRIELGEIESTLLKHTDVREAVVHLIRDTDTDKHPYDKRLVAYVVRQQPALPNNDPIYPQLADTSINVISDPLIRAEFKLCQKGIRTIEGPVQIDLPYANDDIHRQNYLARQSYRQFVKMPIPLDAFGIWLNNLRQLHLDDTPLPKYLYPSGGGLYPVQTYLYIKPDQISGVSEGFYYYHPAKGQLILIGANHDDTTRLFASGHQHIYDAAAFALFLIGNLEAIRPMYGTSSRDYCLLEAGYIGQLLMQTAPTQNIGLCPMGTVDEPLLCKFLELDENYLALHCLVGGRIDSSQMEQWLQPQGSQSREQQLGKLKTNVLWQDELRAFLATKLHSHMIPTTFVELDSLPLSANGKVDRNALPAPDLNEYDAAKTVVAPRTPVEEQIAEMWREVLNNGTASIDHDFFEMGGDSLMATRLLTRLRQAFDVELSLRTIFANPTIAQLAGIIDAESLTTVDPALLEAAMAKLMGKE